MKRYFRVSRRRNPMRKERLTPEEVTKFRILKKLSGAALQRRLPAWARAKSVERFTFIPGQKAKYPSWTTARAMKMAPEDMKFPDERRWWTAADYIKEFNRLNNLKQNPKRKKRVVRRRAVNPRTIKYEIHGNGKWFPVTKTIFRSWSGKRRLNGKLYRGHVYYLGTDNIARSVSRRR